jgi:hypothetical protein
MALKKDAFRNVKFEFESIKSIKFQDNEFRMKESDDEYIEYGIESMPAHF